MRLLTLERPFPAEGRYPSDPYVGPHVCAECHPGESALYARSGHAQTLGSAGSRAVARRLDGTTVADPEHSEVSWGYRYRDGDLHIARTAQGKVEECVAEYAFGSGHHATTFVNVIDPKIPAILEHRITYYTKDRALGLTPGHDTQPPPPGLTPLGGVLPARDARKCFGCHTTQTSARDDKQKIDDATMIPNVSCERCHGPGRAHVEAARRGAPDAELELPFGTDRFTADSLLMLCGTCHRHPSKARPGQIRADNPQLARFQPVGILASRCFRGEWGRIQLRHLPRSPFAIIQGSRGISRSACPAIRGAALNPRNRRPNHPDCRSPRRRSRHPPAPSPRAAIASTATCLASRRASTSSSPTTGSASDGPVR